MSEGVYISKRGSWAWTCDHKKMDQWVLEDKATFSSIVAEHCLNVRVKMMGKCTVTMKKEIGTHEQTWRIFKWKYYNTEGRSHAIFY